MRGICNVLVSWHPLVCSQAQGHDPRWCAILPPFLQSHPTLPWGLRDDSAPSSSSKGRQVSPAGCVCACDRVPTCVAADGQCDTICHCHVTTCYYTVSSFSHDLQVHDRSHQRLALTDHILIFPWRNWRAYITSGALCYSSGRMRILAPSLEAPPTISSAVKTKNNGQLKK